MYLDKITSPADLRALDLDQLDELCGEIREFVEKLQAPERPDFELDLTRMRSAEVVAAEMYEAVPSDFE